MVVVLLLIAVLASLTPIMVNEIGANSEIALSATNQRAALAAADAGVQWYKNHLDTNPAYYDDTDGGDLASLDDPAMGAGNWCTSGTASCGLPSSAPEEAFHYTPYSGSASNPSELLLEVTGRAGDATPYAYTTVLATFTRASILDNVYFSNYELLDPDVIASYVDDAANGDASETVQSAAQGYKVTVNGTSESVLAATVSDPATGGNVTLWNALCDYYTYEENSFIDAIGSDGDGQTYSSTHPYYGPFTGNTLRFTDGSETVSSTDASNLCGGTFDFVTGDVFDGPVYTEDQLHICGSPSFEGKPVSYTSGAPADLNYGYDVPGSVEVTAANSGPGKTYPTPPPGGPPVYSPGGVIDETSTCATNDPTFAAGGDGGPVLNGNEAIPSTNSALLSLAESSGCVFTGPTLIELVTVSGQTTMDVWSPLSSPGATSARCGSPADAPGAQAEFSASNPFVTDIALPANGVVYVSGASGTGASVPDCVDANAPSTNEGDGANSDNENCTAGTAFVEGELSGQLTIAAADNIVVTRDLTYNCADSTEPSGSASATDPSDVSTCMNATTPDLLGLDAGDDVIVARPSATTDPSYCSYDGTGKPPGTTTTALIADGWPNCEMKNPIIDAAVMATQGSFGVQSYDLGTNDGNVALNGSDVGSFRGPFGTFESCGESTCIVSGYNKDFSFDTRLAYLTPPGLLGLSSANWQEDSVTTCGEQDTESSPALACPGLGNAS